MTNASTQIDDNVDNSRKSEISSRQIGVQPEPGLGTSPVQSNNREAAARSMRVSFLMDLLCSDDEAPDTVRVPSGGTIASEVVVSNEFDDPQLYVPGAWHTRGRGDLKQALSWVRKNKPGLMPLARVLLPRLPCYLLSSST